MAAAAHTVSRRPRGGAGSALLRGIGARWGRHRPHGLEIGVSAVQRIVRRSVFPLASDTDIRVMHRPRAAVVLQFPVLDAHLPGGVTRVGASAVMIDVPTQGGQLVDGARAFEHTPDGATGLGVLVICHNADVDITSEPLKRRYNSAFTALEKR